MQCLEWLLKKHLFHASKLHQIHTLLITSGFLAFPLLSQSQSRCGGTTTNTTTTTTTTTFVYNCLLRAYLRNGQSSSAALHLFVQMLAHGHQPNHHTFPSLIKFSSSSPSPSYAGCALHAQCLRRGLLADNFISCSLVKYYAQLGHLNEARKSFDEMPHPDMACHNAMLDAFCANGDIISARRLFESMSTRDVISWTIIINGHSRNRCFREAIGLFRRLMRESRRSDIVTAVTPNEATLVSVLSACANLHGPEGLAIGIEIHGGIIRREAQLTAFLGTALIDMLGAEGQPPNHITFIAVLTACARAGLVETGLRLFEMMVSKHGVTPLMEHYGCVVDLLSRNGLLNQAVEFIKRMPMAADASVWGALQGACKLYGDVELGAKVGRRLMALQPENAGRYMILRNIYAGEGRWNHAAELREIMEQAGVKKMVGQSCVGSPADSAVV
ncbi:putative pentatricopeptide repeat-containing protein At1g10330 [Ananas comosus]|uniref:Pentatricopeptide repeat-containing protein At1g10330 n=1 Tax=Ananas comosus TaxID=4615 RepID=A0A6P5FM76_ANACO|nr:putative pentatricopeptide repeat-containing protein At1g10330 [Ananas comosus]